MRKINSMLTYITFSRKGKISVPTTIIREAGTFVLFNLINRNLHRRRSACQVLNRGRTEQSRQKRRPLARAALPGTGDGSRGVPRSRTANRQRVSRIYEHMQSILSQKGPNVVVSTTYRTLRYIFFLAPVPNSRPRLVGHGLPVQNFWLVTENLLIDCKRI
jgi:hypothetical protein